MELMAEKLKSDRRFVDNFILFDKLCSQKEAMKLRGGDYANKYAIEMTEREHKAHVSSDRSLKVSQNKES